MNSFKKLHSQNHPLIIGNVWNVRSALMYEKIGYKAIGTSSAAIADSMGYEDGEKIPFDELLLIVEKIQHNISIPLTVDIERGYGSNNKQIIDNIKELIKRKVAGINIEDSSPESVQVLKTPEGFSRTLDEISNYLTQSKSSLFVNVRTDAYIASLDNPLEETLSRIKHYSTCGIDGIFVPCVTAIKEIERIVKSTHLPVNVMCMPTLPDFLTLQKLGVKRISMGPFAYNKINKNTENDMQKIIKNNNFSVLF